jgi:hypothetical protein
MSIPSEPRHDASAIDILRQQALREPRQQPVSPVRAPSPSSRPARPSTEIFRGWRGQPRRAIPAVYLQGSRLLAGDLAARGIDPSKQGTDWTADARADLRRKLQKVSAGGSPVRHWATFTQRGYDWDRSGCSDNRMPSPSLRRTRPTCLGRLAAGSQPRRLGLPRLRLRICVGANGGDVPKG